MGGRPFTQLTVDALIMAMRNRRPNPDESGSTTPTRAPNTQPWPLGAPYKRPESEDPWDRWAMPWITLWPRASSPPCRLSCWIVSHGLHVECSGRPSSNTSRRFTIAVDAIPPWAISAQLILRGGGILKHNPLCFHQQHQALYYPLKRGNSILPFARVTDPEPLPHPPRPLSPPRRGGKAWPP